MCHYKNIHTCNQCDQKKFAKCLKKLPNSDFTRKMKDLTPIQNLPKNVRGLGKLIVANGIKKLPKVQKIVQSCHTTCNILSSPQWNITY